MFQLSQVSFKKIRKWCMCVLKSMYKLYKKKTLHVGDH